MRPKDDLSNVIFWNFSSEIESKLLLKSLYSREVNKSPINLGLFSSLNRVNITCFFSENKISDQYYANYIMYCDYPKIASDKCYCYS